MKQRMHLTRTVNLQIRKINGDHPALYTKKSVTLSLVPRFEAALDTLVGSRIVPSKHACVRSHEMTPTIGCLAWPDHSDH